MARLEALPDRATILAMRGTVDYYYWKGIPVARSWPSYKAHERSEAEIASSQAFAAASVMTGALSAEVQRLYRRQLVAHGYTWVDLFRATARQRSWLVG